MAANTLNIFLPMTGFLDTEIAPAIKPTPQNKGQNVDTKFRLNGRDLRYIKGTKVLDHYGSSILVTPHVSVNIVKMVN